MTFVIVTGIWSEQNRSQDSLEKKTNSPPPPPVWSPKSAPPSPTTDRKFRPVPFESPTLQRRKLPSVDSPSPPPWQQSDYADNPYQPSIIKSSSLNTISAPRIKPNHITFRKARGNERKIDSYHIHPISYFYISSIMEFSFSSPPFFCATHKRHLSQLIFFTHYFYISHTKNYYFFFFFFCCSCTADQFDNKGLQNSSLSHKEKSITFKTTPLKSSKSNELGMIKLYLLASI